MLSEKIAALRRQKGWSQEELAEKLDVSRQAVSKWESAQSTPDVERIVQLAELFHVSTDYLLREGENVPAMEPAAVKAEEAARQVSLEEAGELIDLSRSNSGKIAFGVLLCVFSPICLMMLLALADAGRAAEGFAVAAGLIVLLMMVAAAVGLFVWCGMKGEKFEYIEKENISIDAETLEMVKGCREELRPDYVRGNIIAACICVLSPVPVFLGMMKENELLMMAAVCCTVAMAGIGAALFALGGVKWSALQKLLQEGDYTPFEKRANVLREKVAPVYWLGVTAVYLAWSFAGGEWDESWIIWPVAGVIFAGVSVICGIVQKNREEK